MMSYGMMCLALACVGLALALALLAGMRIQELIDAELINEWRVQLVERKQASHPPGYSPDGLGGVDLVSAWDRRSLVDQFDKSKSKTTDEMLARFDKMVAEDKARYAQFGRSTEPSFEVRAVGIAGPEVKVAIAEMQASQRESEIRAMQGQSLKGHESE